MRVLLSMITFLECASECGCYYLYEHCRNTLQNAGVIIYTNIVETRFRMRVLLSMIIFLECASKCGCYYLYEHCRNALQNASIIVCNAYGLHRPTQSVSCAAGRRLNWHEQRHATTFQNRAQPRGRASGVNCTQCWAAMRYGFIFVLASI